MLPLECLNTLFTQARTHTAWQSKPVADTQLQKIYDLMKWGATSANCSPARIVFVKSEPEKDKLLLCISPSNHEKVKTAPVTAIVGMDMRFYDKLPQLFPHTDARSWFIEKESMIEATAFRNSSIQGAYLMLAARAMGLDVGPMSGFNAEQINASFFADGDTKVNFLCNLGYGKTESLRARSPRLSFDEACTIV